MSLITPEFVLMEHRDRLAAADRARQNRCDPGRSVRTGRANLLVAVLRRMFRHARTP